MLKIEKGIPVSPIKHNVANNSYNTTFAQMDVGDSFEVKGDGRKVASRLSVASAQFRKSRFCDHPDCKFTVRNLGKSARVWRVA